MEIDVAALVRDTGARWKRLARRRKVDVSADGAVAARVPTGAVMQVLDVLIGNAVTHGRGGSRYGSRRTTGTRS
jgi:signal transduction histidine kinase